MSDNEDVPFVTVTMKARLSNEEQAELITLLAPFISREGEVNLTFSAGMKDTIPTPISLDASIDELELTGRARNILWRFDIKTVGQLIERSENDFDGFSGFGRKSKQDVIDRLAHYGLELKRVG